MRLLDTATVTLHEFHGDSIPPYAILSHTWEEDEVSYQLLPKPEAKALAGYAKIVSFCELAAAQGWKYGWVDTCCIDKTSSAELSEAINSMWRWYEKSGVCIAFLADCSWRSYNHLLDSRWFTRGWTLQELLAPAKVVFYDGYWNELGDKEKLEWYICYATGISKLHLLKPGSASIAAKMSWMSRRQTTRLEDLAYSLLGLFDVYMPLIYGEGSNAFIRLQQEIVKSSNDETIFAWTDETLTEAGMLALSPAAFQNSGNVVTFQHPVIRRRPYSITNFGLEIEAISSSMRTDNTISASGSHLHRLPIACTRKDERKPLAVSLLSVAGKTVRVDLGHLRAFEEPIDPQKGYQTIYVKSSYLCKHEGWREPPLEIRWNEAFEKSLCYSGLSEFIAGGLITEQRHQYGGTYILSLINFLCTTFQNSKSISDIRYFRDIRIARCLLVNL